MPSFEEVNPCLCTDHLAFSQLLGTHVIPPVQGQSLHLDFRLSQILQASVQFSSVADGTPGLSVHHQLSEFTQIHVHQVGDAIKTSHPLSSHSLLAFNLSQHQGLFK